MGERKSGLVSIVVPVYNAGQFIAETIHCVQAQTYRAWELLLVEDGSSDGSREIIQQNALKMSGCGWWCRRRTAVLRGHETAACRRHAGSICVFGRR